MKAKRIVSILLLAVMCLSMAACGKEKTKKYQKYVNDLITANYIGATDDYIEATGANKSDAEAMYENNITRLAEALKSYYGLNILEDDELFEDLKKLAGTIYSSIKYSTKSPEKKGGSYTVDVEIYPIDILNQTDGDVKAYVEDFNKRVSAGEFNSYEREAYEHEFAEGIVEILQNAVKNLQYAEPVTVTTTIYVEGDTFYISNEDFIKIDDVMIAQYRGTETEQTDDK
ncbi:MAG: hypothetical protein IJJ74_03740 [Eubacterium sp.]|nr:hypothetical protein [Eubacterium sp.]MBR1675457.1 hypothetical protein [Eubacterium sp.]